MILDKIYNYGWYGECNDTPCEPFELASHAASIREVYQINASGEGYASWKFDEPAFLNKFSSLECGNAYNVVLQPGATIEIPHFIRTDEGVEGAIKLLNDGCGSTHPTPTPIIPDPTPRPDPTPYSGRPTPRPTPTPYPTPTLRPTPTPYPQSGTPYPTLTLRPTPTP